MVLSAERSVKGGTNTKGRFTVMNSKIALLMAEIFSIKREVSKALKYDKSLLATKKKKKTGHLRWLYC